MCGGRKVSVFRDESSGTDTLLGTRRTDGIFHAAVIRWLNPDPQEIAGSYYATVKEATKHHKGKTLQCRPARSKPIDIVAPNFLTASRGMNEITLLGSHP